MSITPVTTEKFAQSAAALAGWRALTPPAWLEAAIQPERVCAALVQHVPEFSSGRLRIDHCEVKRLRLRDNKGSWSGTYLFTVTGLQPDQAQVVPVSGVLSPAGSARPQTANGNAPFGSTEWRCYLPELHLELRAQPPDTELAILPQLTDPEQARLLLEEGIRRGSPNYHDLRIASCTPRVMRYKPGSRCTILYRLTYAPDAPGHTAWPTVVVAKTHRGDEGKIAYEGMKALWESPLQKSHTVAIAEPLAYIPEVSLLIQGPIREEQTLKQALRTALRVNSPEGWATFNGYLRKTAIGLAELHQCGVTTGETVTWEDELDDILKQQAKLATPIPQLAELARPLLDYLQHLDSLYPAEPPQPAHRSFRPAQVLLYQGEIGFIDFDGFCQAEPAMDIALFLTTVKKIVLNQLPAEEDEDDEENEILDNATRNARMAQAEEICETFMQAYEQHASVSRQRIALWEALDLLSLLIGSWTKIKLTRIENCIFSLEHHFAMNQELFAG